MKVTKSLNTWDVKNGCVERLTDNIAYTSSSADDALVLVGPPRYSKAKQNELYPIGLLQQFSYSQSRQVAPQQTIGSGRAYMTSGKSMVQFNIARLFAKGPNLLKALMKNAETQGIDLARFGERPISNNAKNFAVNLDSELFLIPFGMQVVYRDKSNNSLGGVYLEMCMISSYNTSISAGSSVLMEQVGGLADRLFSVDVGSVQSGYSTGAFADSTNTSESVTEAIFGQSSDGISA